MTLTDLLTEQRAALEAGDTTQALDILDQIEREVSKANAWDWLTTHDPESYDQLCQKLEDARASLLSRASLSNSSVSPASMCSTVAELFKLLIECSA